MQNPSGLRYVWIYLDHLQRVNKHQQSTYKNMDELLDTIKCVHKMCVDNIKFVVSKAELFRKVWRL